MNHYQGLEDYLNMIKHAIAFIYGHPFSVNSFYFIMYILAFFYTNLEIHH